MGLTERFIKEENTHKYVIGKKEAERTPIYALQYDKYHGIAKITVERKTGLIKGAEIMHEKASELIHMISVAMKAEMTIDKFAQIVIAHPSSATIL